MPFKNLYLVSIKFISINPIPKKKYKKNYTNEPMCISLMNKYKIIIQSQYEVLKFLFIFTFIILSGCASMAIGGGATLGTAAYQERGIEGVARDMATTIRMQASLLKAGEIFVTGVSVDVFEGRMLLTGTLPDKKLQSKAVSIAWKNRWGKRRN